MHLLVWLIGSVISPYIRTCHSFHQLQMVPLTLRGKELPGKRKVKRKPLAKRKHVEVEYEEELHSNRQDAGLWLAGVSGRYDSHDFPHIFHFRQTGISTSRWIAYQGYESHGSHVCFCGRSQSSYIWFLLNVCCLFKNTNQWIRDDMGWHGSDPSTCTCRV